MLLVENYASLALMVVAYCVCAARTVGSVEKRSVQAVAPVYSVPVLRNIAAERSDMTTFMSAELDPFLVVRVSGTPGNTQVRNYIKQQMEGMDAGWDVELDTFQDQTPYGLRTFSNVVATLDRRAPRRLVLACHYDSKYSTQFRFVAATDSAVPCAMLLNLARVFDQELKYRTNRLDTTLQLIFFDGEEAFQEWSATDSLYGSRHLAAKMATTPHPFYPMRNQLQSMDAFVLLDLLGAAKPVLFNFYKETSNLFKAMQSIEDRLMRNNLTNPSRSMFSAQKPWTTIEDDHVPFLNRGVPILHLIAYPFPPQWHKVTDTKANLNVATIDNLNRVLRVFVAEYLDL